MLRRNLLALAVGVPVTACIPAAAAVVPVVVAAQRQKVLVLGEFKHVKKDLSGVSIGCRGIREDAYGSGMDPNYIKRVMIAGQINADIDNASPLLFDQLGVYGVDWDYAPAE